VPRQRILVVRNTNKYLDVLICKSRVISTQATGYQVEQKLQKLRLDALERSKLQKRVMRHSAALTQRQGVLHHVENNVRAAATPPSQVGFPSPFLRWRKNWSRQVLGICLANPERASFKLLSSQINPSSCPLGHLLQRRTGMDSLSKRSVCHPICLSVSL
jgi:hypothetical protein